MERTTGPGNDNEAFKENIKWISITTHVDEDTGEIITKEQAQQHYSKIKSEKNVRFNANQNQGTIEWTTTWRRRAQLTLF